MARGRWEEGIERGKGEEAGRGFERGSCDFRSAPACMASLRVRPNPLGIQWE